LEHTVDIGRNLQIFLNLPLFNGDAETVPLGIVQRRLGTKTRTMGLSGEKEFDDILSHLNMGNECDRQTDGRTPAADG